MSEDFHFFFLFWTHWHQYWRFEWSFAWDPTFYLNLFCRAVATKSGSFIFSHKFPNISLVNMAHHWLSIHSPEIWSIWFQWAKLKKGKNVVTLICMITVVEFHSRESFNLFLSSELILNTENVHIKKGSYETSKKFLKVATLFQ